MLQKCFLIIFVLLFSFTATAFADEPYDKESVKFNKKIFKKILDYRYHHLGNDYIGTWVIPEPEGTYWETKFWLRKNDLNSKEIAFVKFLAKDIGFSDLIVNDNRIKIHEADAPTTQNYLIYIIPVPVDLLQIGKNLIGIETNQWDTGNFDDMEFGELEIWLQ
jgi:hypothetical protein